MWAEGSHCFEKLFEEMEQNSDKGRMLAICCSEEIGEDYPSGYYFYKSGSLTDDIFFLYHQSPNHIEYASRISIYGPLYTIEVRGDSINLQVFETIQTIRDLFLVNDDEQQEGLKRFLKKTDRVTFEGLIEDERQMRRRKNEPKRTHRKY